MPGWRLPLRGCMRWTRTCLAHLAWRSALPHRCLWRGFARRASRHAVPQLVAAAGGVPPRAVRMGLLARRDGWQRPLLVPPGTWYFLCWHGTVMVSRLTRLMPYVSPCRHLVFRRWRLRWLRLIVHYMGLWLSTMLPLPPCRMHLSCCPPRRRGQVGRSMGEWRWLLMPPGVWRWLRRCHSGRWWRWCGIGFLVC